MGAMMPAAWPGARLVRLDRGDGRAAVTINWLVVTLSVSAAFAFSVSTTLKKASASQVPDVRHPHAGGVARFVQGTLTHPLWLAGLAADAVGLSLQVTALHLGALALVQPLLVSGLLFALLLRHRRVWHISRQESIWAVVLTGCLIGFLSLSGSISSQQQPSTADRLPAAIAALAGLLTAGTCLILAHRLVPSTSRAALIGIAVGAIFAGTAALIKATTNVLTAHGPAAVLTSWQLYAVLVLGGIGLFLTQVAFQAGPLTASLPAISTVDPLVSVAIGGLVYDEHLRRGPLAGLVLLALLLLLATAVIALSRVEAAEVSEPTTPAASEGEARP